MNPVLECVHAQGVVTCSVSTGAWLAVVGCVAAGVLVAEMVKQLFLMWVGR